MAAFIPAFAKKRIWPDRAADFRRDWRSNGDRHSTGHGYHQYRPRPEVTKHGAQGVALRRPAVAAPAQWRLTKSFALARDLVVFTAAIGIALAGLVSAIITPPI